MNCREQKLFFLLICLLISLVGGCNVQKDDRLCLSPDLRSRRITGVEGTELKVNCTAHVQEPIYSLKWDISQKAQTIKQEVSNENGTVSLIISPLHRSDAGTYTCELVMGSYVEKKEFHLFVSAKERDESPCRITQFKCKITQYCIFQRYRCDGKDDCEDGSDEDCGGHQCDDKFICNNMRCVDRRKQCDHNDDCGDGSDELKSVCEPTKDSSSSLSLPKKTIFLVIASIIFTVILICFIVISGCRLRMKRQRRETQHIYSMRRGVQGNSVLQEISETPRSVSQAEESGGEGQPFLMNSYPPYRNIIVNVNNGVQYMSRYDCPMRPFMDAPPPYSEIRRTHARSENAPPPYTAFTPDPTSESLAPGNDRGDASNVNSVDRRMGRGNEHTLDEGHAIVPERERDFSISSAAPEDSSIDQSRNVNTGCDQLGVTSDANSGVANESCRTNNFDYPEATASGHWVPESRDSIHEVSTMQSRPRSCIVQTCDGQDDALATEDSPTIAHGVGNVSVPDLETVNTASIQDRNFNALSSVGATYQSSSLPLIESDGHQSLSSPSIRGDERQDPTNHSSQPSSISVPSPVAVSGGIRSSDLVSETVLLYPSSSPARPLGHGNHDDASSALLQEVSRRDERNRPQPGHLSVQGGQIVLNSDSGVVTGQTILPTIGNGMGNAQGQGSVDQPSAAASQLGGELVVKDGVIMLQIPVSQLILSKQDKCQPIACEPVRAAADQNMTDGSVPRLSFDNDLSLSTHQSPPVNLSSSPSVLEGSNAVNPSPSNVARFCGDLNIRDGQIVLEPPRHTPSFQILSHLQGAYSKEGNDPSLTNSEDRPPEPVVNTKRVSGVAIGGRQFNLKCNSDVVLPHGKDQQDSS